MKVVLDTSVFDNDLGLEGDSALKVAGNLSLINAELVIPAVVLAEVLDHVQERLEEVLRPARPIPIAALNGLGLRSENLVSLGCDAVKRRLEAVATIAPYPDLSHAEVVSRMLQGRRPFKPRQRESKNKEKGYKDALLWASVLSLVRAGDSVALITANKGDFFASDDGIELHGHLIDDLKALGPLQSEVVLYVSLADFYKREISPRLPTAEVSQWVPQDTDGQGVNFIQEMDALVPTMFDNWEGNPTDIGLPYRSEPPFVPIGWDIVDVSVFDKREATSGQLYVELEATIHTLVGFYVHRSETQAIDDLDYRVQLTDSSYYYEAEREVTLQVQASLTIDPNTSTVVTASVVAMRLAQS